MNSFVIPYPARAVRWSNRAPGTAHLLPVWRRRVRHVVPPRRLPVTVGRLTGRLTGDAR